MMASLKDSHHQARREDEAVKIGDLEKNSEAIKVVRPKFNKEVLTGAIIRERVGDLTLRTGRAGMLGTFINTIRVEVGRWGPPVVDEGWHAVCQAICMGVEGVGELVPHVCGDEQGSPMFVTQVQVAGQRRFG